MLLDKQGAAEDSHDFVDVSFKFHFMFDYCDNAVSAYSRINLYSDGCLGITPECGDSKVLFDPFEEKYDWVKFRSTKSALNCIPNLI